MRGLCPTICCSFYKKMGFHELSRGPEDIWMGLRFPNNVPAPSLPAAPATSLVPLRGVLEGAAGDVMCGVVELALRACVSVRHILCFVFLSNR